MIAECAERFAELGAASVPPCPLSCDCEARGRQGPSLVNRCELLLAHARKGDIYRSGYLVLQDLASPPQPKRTSTTHVHQ